MSTIGRPVARRLNPATTVEVTRLCVDASLEPALVWNACSMLYAAAAREAEQRGFARIITYTLESEDGTSLTAAGFRVVARSAGGSWHRPGRARTDTAPITPKLRWERTLRPARRAQLALADREATRAAARDATRTRTAVSCHASTRTLQTSLF